MVRTFFGVTFNQFDLNLLFAGVLSLFIITLIGFLDDLLISSDKEESKGFGQIQKPLLTLIAAIPLMVVNAGVTLMALPFIGHVDFGVFYVLILIPLGVLGASNMVNMFAGFNGLEAGMGIIYTGMLGIYAYVNNFYIAAWICLLAFSALLAFYYFNKVPAKILAGDSLTYLLGGVLVSVAILGNIEKAALIVSIPFFIEFILKLRGRLKKQSYGYWYKGKVKSFYKNIYSLPHIFTRTGKFTEKQITWSLIAIEFVFCLLIWVV